MDNVLAGTLLERSRRSPAEVIGRSHKSLGETPFLTGDLPSGADASVFAEIASPLTDFFESHARDALLLISNLVHYHKRMMAIYFPDFEWLSKTFGFATKLRTGKEGRMKIAGLQASILGS